MFVAETSLEQIINKSSQSNLGTAASPPITAENNYAAKFPTVASDGRFRRYTRFAHILMTAVRKITRNAHNSPDIFSDVLCVCNLY